MLIINALIWIWKAIAFLGTPCTLCMYIICKITNFTAQPQYSEYQWVHSAVQRGAPFLRSLLAVTSQFSVLIGEKMQLTGWNNGNPRANGAKRRSGRKLEARVTNSALAFTYLWIMRCYIAQWHSGMKSRPPCGIWTLVDHLTLCACASHHWSQKYGGLSWRANTDWRLPKRRKQRQERLPQDHKSHKRILRRDIC